MQKQPNERRQLIREYLFIIEGLAGILLLAVIDSLLLKKSGAFVGVHPHPYWIIVLLLACRYGVVQGLFAGAMAALGYILFAGKAGLLDFSGSSFPHGPFMMPFLFILIGGLVGEIRSQYRRRYDRLREKYETTYEEWQNLSTEYKALTSSKWELEKRVALQSTTMASLFRQLTQVDQTDPEHFYKQIPELLRDQLNVTCSSVYLLVDNKLRLSAREGTQGSNGLPNVLELDAGMVGEVVRRKKMIVINRGVGSKEMQRFQSFNLIMSAPILRKDGSLVGVINVERIPFLDFTANAVRVFETLAEWVSIAIDQAMQFKHFKDRNIADEITGAYNYLHFQKRLEYEIARAKRFHTTLSLMLLEIEQFDDMNASERRNILVVINWIFSNILRDTDIISKYREDRMFAVILPGQSSMDCERIIERISAEVHNYQLKPFEDREEILRFRTAISTLQIPDGSHESMIEAVEKRLKSGNGLPKRDVYDDIRYLLDLHN